MICENCQTTGLILNGDMTATPCPSCQIGSNLRSKLYAEPACLRWEQLTFGATTNGTVMRKPKEQKFTREEALKNMEDIGGEAF